MSPNQKDRMLRYVWGMDRLEFCAGEWDRRYADIDNEPPKYIGKPRWVLEGWQSPDVFDKAEWLRDEHLLGAWPANGVWDFIEYHETTEREFLPLDNSALDRVRNWKHWRSKGFKRAVEAMMEARMLRYSLQQQRNHEAGFAVAQQFGEDVVKCFENGVDQVSTSGRNIGYKKTESGLLVPNN
jgi:hypothetical protein